MTADVRSARLTAWGTAFLDGRASLDEATLRIVEVDRGHDVVGLPEVDGPLTLTLALGWLRRRGVTGLRLILPTAGDPGGLAGPPTLTSAAVAAGEAVLTAGGPGLGLVPHVAGSHVVWRAQPAEADLVVATSLGEAERMLTETLLECTDALHALDVAALTPEAAEALERYRDEDRRGAGALPPGYPPRAARVLALADRLTAITELATRDDGAARSGTRADQRRALLTEVTRAARLARIAAYNAVLEPSR